MTRDDLRPGEDHHDSNGLDEKDIRIIRSIRAMRDLDPPPELLSSVMEAIQLRKSGWWYRLYLWACTPKTVRFTPLALGRVTAAFFVITFFLGLLLFEQKRVSVPQHSADYLIPVIFSLNLSGAQSVSVVGSFNGWKPEGYEMKLDRDSKRWMLTVLLPDGRHEYMFLVDGHKLILDPEALIHQEDGFGNRNSVLVLRRNGGENS